MEAGLQIISAENQKQVCKKFISLQTSAILSCSITEVILFKNKSS